MNSKSVSFGIAITTLFACGYLCLLSTHSKFTVKTESKVMCNEDQSEQEVSKSAIDTLFCMDDAMRVRNVLEAPSDKITMLNFYQMLSNPIQSACKSLHRVGYGKWFRREFDGPKYACMDDFQGAMALDCLVYSFGIGGDITFEQQLLRLGCEIHAYDHTVNQVSLLKKTKTTDKETIPLGTGIFGPKMLLCSKNFRKRDQLVINIYFGWPKVVLSGIPLRAILSVPLLS